MPVKCSYCNKEINNKDIRVCPSCSSMICDSCYSNCGGLCEYCSHDLTYLQ